MKLGRFGSASFISQVQMRWDESDKAAFRQNCKQPPETLQVGFGSPIKSYFCGLGRTGWSQLLIVGHY